MKHNTHPNRSLPVYFNRPASALYNILIYLLAGILAFAGVAKLIDASGLLSTLQQLFFLNDALIVWIATLLPILEISLAVSLFTQWNPELTLIATLLLFMEGI